MTACDLTRYVRAFLVREKRRPRLLFVVTEDWYFVSHRITLAKAARNAGFDVAIATRVSADEEVIRAAGLNVYPVDFNRGGVHPLHDLKTFRRLVEIYRSFHPDIAHHVALKPALYGSLAACLTGRPKVVNALGGLGYVFSSKSWRARILHSLIKPILGFAMRMHNSRLIVQNEQDLQRVVDERLAHPETVRLIPGAGVELERYRQTDAGGEPPLVILPARLLRDKGVGEFVEAASILKREGSLARFALVGRPDPLNPASVSQAEIDAWVSGGLVEAWGWQEDMPAILSQTQIVCLPSYHEGLPKTLLEAAASGCAMIATDIAGCRAVVREGETGLLVPVGDTQALAAALRRMTTDADLRRWCGANARSVAGERFSIERVISRTFEIYRELLWDTRSER
ncbi:glycosyltransferase family 4 protein [Pseudaminobacter sp. NGMCC 1.201702]|uniref:glycosyltransferase family 4 protein n=1 Tax=Pseudaminobacter sp. NGMCC 1.201702 TaxID=3391825 RepID=UPI0039EE79A9